jgi:hypothetical protein
MTAAGDERTHDGAGSHRDVVDVQIRSESVVLAVRIARVTGQASAEATAIVFSGEDRVLEVFEETGGAVDAWERASVGPVTLTVEEPLERWSVRLEGPAVEASVELRALTPPLALAEPATAAVGRAAGVERYSQLCEARGTARFGQRSRALDGLAVRTHRWGPAGEAGRARFVTAASEAGALLSIAAVRPPGAAAHGDELVAGHTLAAGNGAAPEPLPFETVRLSTVFDEHGLPVKAGAELFRAGEELPSRLAGTALAGASSAGGLSASLTVFAFTLDGVPAFGLYEVEGA